jgi:hypothetical protein
VFPLLDDAEPDALALDIQPNGLRHACVVDPHGTLLDGRNRLLACARVGVTPQFTEYARHLTQGQRAMLAVKTETVYLEVNSAHGITRAAAAQAQRLQVVNAEDLALVAALAMCRAREHELNERRVRAVHGASLMIYICIHGAMWPLLPFLQGRAVALLLPATRARALAKLVAVAVALAALEPADVDQEQAA